MRQGTETSTRWAAVAAAAVLATAAAGCGGAAGTPAGAPAGSGAAASGATVTTTVETQPPPVVDPAVAHWARAWKRKIEAPMVRAANRLAGSINAVMAGNSTAAYRITRPLDALSNCRNPLELGLAQTPPDLTRARRRTLGACREIFIGTNTFVAGINSLSPAQGNAGLARIRDGVKRLRRIAREVKRAAQPQ